MVYSIIDLPVDINRCITGLVDTTVETILSLVYQPGSFNLKTIYPYRIIYPNESKINDHQSNLGDQFDSIGESVWTSNNLVLGIKYTTINFVQLIYFDNRKGFVALYELAEVGGALLLGAHAPSAAHFFRSAKGFWRSSADAPFWIK